MAQLSAEITANQNKINALNLKIERLNNEKKELQTELRATRATLSNVRKDLKEMKAKNDRLLKTIAVSGRGYFGFVITSRMSVRRTMKCDSSGSLMSWMIRAKTRT